MKKYTLPLAFLALLTCAKKNGPVVKLANAPEAASTAQPAIPVATTNAPVAEPLKAVERPKFLKAIYLTNGTARDAKMLTRFVEKSVAHGMNALVIDAQGKRIISPESMALLAKNNIYPIARIVCFNLGLKKKYPDEKRITKILAEVERAAKLGFREIQLDYIRYADQKDMERLPLKFKYAQISQILARARKLTDSLGVELGADVFGRVTLNNNDAIGQKLEVFGTYVQNLYPMVYPSHYYGDNEKINNPYGTVKEGVENSKERIPKTRIIPYVQGFGMKVKRTGLTLPQYVLKQFFAVDDANGDGYVVWNARNDYSATWKAAQEYARLAPTRKKPVKLNEDAPSTGHSPTATQIPKA